MQYAVPFCLPSLKDITQSINVLLFLDFNWEQPHDHANCPLDCEISSVLRWVSSPDEFTNVDGYRDSWLQLKLGKDRIFFGSCLAKYVLMRYYIYFVLYAQLFYLNISSSVTTYHSTPSCLHTQTAAASQPRHHYQHDEQEQLVQGRDIRRGMPKRQTLLGRRWVIFLQRMPWSTTLKDRRDQWRFYRRLA